MVSGSSPRCDQLFKLLWSFSLATCWEFFGPKGSTKFSCFLHRLWLVHLTIAFKLIDWPFTTVFKKLPLFNMFLVRCPSGLRALPRPRHALTASHTLRFCSNRPSQRPSRTVQTKATGDSFDVNLYYEASISEWVVLGLFELFQCFGDICVIWWSGPCRPS